MTNSALDGNSKNTNQKLFSDRVKNSVKQVVEFNLSEYGGSQMNGTKELKQKSYEERILNERRKSKDVDEYMSIPGL
jgi:hypothetical protein